MASRETRLIAISHGTQWKSKNVRMLEGRTGKVLHEIELPRLTSGIKECLHHDDTNEVFLLPGKGCLLVWNLKLGTATHVPHEAIQGRVCGDGQRLLVATRDAVHQWDRITGDWSEVMKIADEAHSVGFSSDGEWLALADSYGISVRDIASGQELRRFSHADGVASNAAFSDDGSILGAVFYDTCCVRFWSMNVGSSSPDRQEWDRAVRESMARSALAWHFRRAPLHVWNRWSLCDSEIFACLRLKTSGLIVYENGMVRQLDTAFQSSAGSFCEGEASSWVTRVEVTEDETTLLLAGKNQLVVINLGTRTARRIPCMLEESADAMLFTGEQIYTTDFADEASVSRWNAVTGAGPEGLFTLPAEMTIPQLHLSEDAGHLIVCGCDGLVLVYDLSTGERMETAGLHRTSRVHMQGDKIWADSIGDAAWVIGK